MREQGEYTFVLLLRSLLLCSFPLSLAMGCGGSKGGSGGGAGQQQTGPVKCNDLGNALASTPAATAASHDPGQKQQKFLVDEDGLRALERALDDALKRLEAAEDKKDQCSGVVEVGRVILTLGSALPGGSGVCSALSRALEIFDGAVDMLSDGIDMLRLLLTTAKRLNDLAKRLAATAGTAREQLEDLMAQLTTQIDHACEALQACKNKKGLSFLRQTTGTAKSFIKIARKTQLIMQEVSRIVADTSLQVRDPPPPHVPPLRSDHARH
jgi:hypothetical protein